MVIVVHGSNQVAQKGALVKELGNFQGNRERPWLAIKDFNAFISLMEKQGHKGANLNLCTHMANCISQVDFLTYKARNENTVVDAFTVAFAGIMETRYRESGITCCDHYGPFFFFKISNIMF
ncbi:hypothetical protein Ancab_005407, partial [Ancistrocladus abbreviatus]